MWRQKNFPTWASMFLFTPRKTSFFCCPLSELQYLCYLIMEKGKKLLYYVLEILLQEFIEGGEVDRGLRWDETRLTKILEEIAVVSNYFIFLIFGILRWAQYTEKIFKKNCKKLTSVLGVNMNFGWPHSAQRGQKTASQWPILEVCCMLKCRIMRMIWYGKSCFLLIISVNVLFWSIQVSSFLKLFHMFQDFP